MTPQRYMYTTNPGQVRREHSLNKSMTNKNRRIQNCAGIREKFLLLESGQRCLLDMDLDFGNLKKLCGKIKFWLNSYKRVI